MRIKYQMENELYHRDFKYIKRYRGKGGKWRYVYANKNVHDRLGYAQRKININRGVISSKHKIAKGVGLMLGEGPITKKITDKIDNSGNGFRERANNAENVLDKMADRFSISRGIREDIAFHKRAGKKIVDKLLSKLKK